MKKSLFYNVVIIMAIIYTIVFIVSIILMNKWENPQKIPTHNTAQFIIENSKIIPFELLKDLSISTGNEIYIKESDGVLLFSSDGRNPDEIKDARFTESAIYDKQYSLLTITNQKYSPNRPKDLVIFLNLFFGSLLAFLTFLSWLFLKKFYTFKDNVLNISLEKFEETSIIPPPNSEQFELKKAVYYISSRLQKLIQKVEEHMYIFDGLMDGVIVIDNKKQIFMINKAAEKFLKLDRNLVKNKNLLDFLTIEEFRALVEMYNMHSANFRFNHQDFTADKLYIEDQTVFVIRDVTEQNEIRRSKTDFVSNVSHELRTPLTLIKGFAETLESEDLTVEQRRYVETILRHSNRVITIVKDLLTLSHIEQESQMSFNNVNLCHIIDEILSIYSYKAKDKKITIKTKPCENLFVSGDRNLLEIVLSNLVDNGIKYNEPNGYVELIPRCENNNIVIDIKDNGIGIPRQDKTRVFERFYTVDKVRSKKVGGTGLGLAISKHIIKLHGGKISIHPNGTRGTIFRITIPKLPD